MLTSKITESSIAQGGLALIIHNEKPTKSGIWRKVREGDTTENLVYYVLEKPLHKDFDADDKELASSHKEQGCFVMTNKTVRNDYSNKYNIIAALRGVDSVKLTLSNYDLNKIDINSNNVKITDDFIKFMDVYNTTNKKVSTLESVAMNCI